MPAAVGVDLGTGSARAVALRPDGSVAGSAAAAYRDAATWPAGRAVAEAWLEAVRAALTELARTCPEAAAPVAVCIGGQSPASVAPEGGLAVTYRHPAGAELAPDLQHLEQRAVLEEEQGRPVAARQAWDWILERLGAEPGQGRWPGDPDLPGYGARRATGEPVGVVRQGEVLPAGTALVTGAQDAYLALWAGGTYLPGRAMDPGGRTGGLAAAAPAGTQVPGMFAAASAVAGVDVLGGPVSAHGLALEWLASLTGTPVDALLTAAETVPAGAGGVLVLPYLEGERAPRWNRRLRGEVTGIDMSTGAAELARAVLESTAYGLAHIAAVLRSGGVAVDELVCAGTPARSALWCAIKAAVLEVPVLVPEMLDLAAYGAALAAGAGAGWWPPPGGDAAAWPRPRMTTVEPRPLPMYRDALRRFIALGDAAERRLELDRAGVAGAQGG